MTPRPPRTSKAIWWIIGIPLTLLAIPIAVFLYYSNLQARWDSKVRELCARDGGVTVYERIPISEDQFAALPKARGSVVVPAEPQRNAPTVPAFYTSSESVIRHQNPTVIRRESLVRRAADGTVVGRIVSYSRIGGDVPIGIGHPSSFICPDYTELSAGQAQFFDIERAGK